MFRKSQDHEGSDPVNSQTVRDRLAGLSLPQLAAEVMNTAFGSDGFADDSSVTVGGPNVGGGPDPYTIADELAPGGLPEPVRQDLARLVAEGLQVLEHAGLVRPQMHTASGSIDFACTRKGRAALRDGSVERLLSQMD